MSARTKLYSLPDLAKKLGVSRTQIYRAKSRGLEVDTSNGSARATVAAYKAWASSRASALPSLEIQDPTTVTGSRLADPSPNGTDELGDKLKLATTTFRQAKAAEALLDLRFRQAELIEVSEIKDLLVDRALLFRKGLATLENRIAAKFPEIRGKLKKVLHEEFKRLLDRYSRSSPLLEGNPQNKRKDPRGRPRKR